MLSVFGFQPNQEPIGSRFLWSYLRDDEEAVVFAVKPKPGHRSSREYRGWYRASRARAVAQMVDRILTAHGK